MQKFGESQADGVAKDTRLSGQEVCNLQALSSLLWLLL